MEETKMVATQFFKGLREQIERERKNNPAYGEDPPTIAPFDEPEPTMMMKLQRAGFDEIGSSRFGATMPASGDYKVMPSRAQVAAATVDRPRWRIELAFESPTIRPLRLEIADGVILGRGTTSDVSFDDYDGIGYGISRQHAMLRPSANALYFFDLGSTNGTRLNGIEVGQGAARPVNMGDLIKLGKLTLTVRRLERV
jgi:hypothetical protein